MSVSSGFAIMNMLVLKFASQNFAWLSLTYNDVSYFLYYIYLLLYILELVVELFDWLLLISHQSFGVDFVTIMEYVVVSIPYAILRTNMWLYNILIKHKISINYSIMYEAKIASGHWLRGSDLVNVTIIVIIQFSSDCWVSPWSTRWFMLLYSQSWHCNDQFLLEQYNLLSWINPQMCRGLSSNRVTKIWCVFCTYVSMCLCNCYFCY